VSSHPDPRESDVCFGHTSSECAPSISQGAREQVAIRTHRQAHIPAAMHDSEVLHPFIRALAWHGVPAHGKIRRRSSALCGTALTCGQLSTRACSSSLTTSPATEPPPSLPYSLSRDLRDSDAYDSADTRPDPATSRTTCGPAAEPVPPSPLSCHASERWPAPTLENARFSDRRPAMCATPLARAAIASTDGRCERRDHGVVFAGAMLLGNQAQIARDLSRPLKPADRGC
jgi:hypothetical protein